VTAGRIRKPTLEGTRDERRADDFLGDVVAELEGAATPAPRDQRDREEVARQRERVVDGVARAELRQDLVDDVAAIVGAQAVRAADAQVVTVVLGERRRDDAVLHERLHQEVSCVDAEARLQIGSLLGVTPPQLGADVHRGMRPRALGEVLDHLADALVAVDQQHVALVQRGAQASEVARQQAVIVAAPSRQRASGGVEQPATQPAHR
jgi:hypothetical protein